MPVPQVLGELIDQEGIIVYQGARYKPLPAIAQVMHGLRSGAANLHCICIAVPGRNHKPLLLHQGAEAKGSLSCRAIMLTLWCIACCSW